MKWLTQEQVKEHATTPAKALEISIRHWQQIVDATEEEHREFRVEQNHALLWGAFCGLCWFHESGCIEKGCPLEKCEDDSQWDKTTEAYNMLHWGGAAFSIFQEEARKMLKLLKSLK